MTRSRLLFVLLLTATLVSQVFAQQHVHAEDASASCLVCAHGDNTPTVQSLQPSSLTVCATTEFVAADIVRLSSEPSTAPRVRGPPQLHHH